MTWTTYPATFFQASTSQTYFITKLVTGYEDGRYAGTPVGGGIWIANILTPPHTCFKRAYLASFVLLTSLCASIVRAKHDTEAAPMSQPTTIERHVSFAVYQGSFLSRVSSGSLGSLVVPQICASWTCISVLPFN